MKRIARYEIQAELGRGAMGVVYRAIDPAIGRPLAIKTIRLGELTSPEEREELRERLFREARSAGMLSHPRIVTVYDVGQEGDTAFIAMELVEGRTLEQILSAEGMLAKEWVLTVLEQTASALDYAHQKGIIHRDIKPANLMMDASGAKVTDFGVAKIVSQDITRTNVVMGTPSYMSPEQIESVTLDGRSDEFALAIVAYELLTGEKPFTGDSLASLAWKIVREDPAWPSRLNPTLPSTVDAVFRRGLAKVATARYSNCQVFVAALGESLANSPGWQPQARGVSEDLPTSLDTVKPPEARTVPPPPPVPRVRREYVAPRRRGVSGWVATVLLAAGAGYYWYAQQQPGPTPAPVLEPVASMPQSEPKPEPVAPPPIAPPDAPPDAQVAAPPVVVPTVQVPKAPVPAAQSVVPPPEHISAVVAVVSNPPGERATLAGSTESCTTPCSLELPEGRHLIRFELADHRTTVGSVEVPGAASVTANLEQRTGALIVRSNPPGAQILVDGRLRPEVTPARILLAAGKHRIVLRRAGSPDEEQDIDVKDQAIAKMEVSWAQ